MKDNIEEKILERQGKILNASWKALEELEKLIAQDIDLTELDPEKAKAAAQGKVEAIEGSMKILKKIQEITGYVPEQNDQEGKKEIRKLAGAERKT